MRPIRRCAALVSGITLLAVGCSSGSTPATPIATATATHTATTTPVASVATQVPSEAAQPTYLRPTTETPAGYRRGPTVPFGVLLAADGVLVSASSEPATLDRWDEATMKKLDPIHLGTPDAFPPDLTALVPGSDGVWVNVPSEHHVALLDPRSGKVTRTVEVEALPFNMHEVDGQLLIVDYGSERLTRYDLASDAVVATHTTTKPTDVLVAEDSIWLAQHVGRRESYEPLSFGGFVERLNWETTTQEAIVKVGSRPGSLVAGFGSVWTGTFAGGSVDRIDASTNEVTTIFVGEDGAFDIEVIGDSVWATTGPQWHSRDAETSFFVRIDPTTNQMRERIGFPCPLDIVPAARGFWVRGDCAEPPTAGGASSTFFEQVE